MGCGPRAVFLPPALRASLKSAGLSLEVVDTGSACRIYNVLLAEGRRVAAALFRSRCAGARHWMWRAPQKESPAADGGASSRQDRA